MHKRLYSRAVQLALFVALLNFALPFVHMAAASAMQQGLVLCSGNGVQIVFTRNTGKDGEEPHATALMQPCALCAHMAQAAPSAPLIPAVAAVTYVHVPLLPPVPQPVRAYAFLFRRGRAPPALYV